MTHYRIVLDRNEEENNGTQVILIADGSCTA